MSFNVSIRKHTSIGDIEENWLPNEDGRIVFDITKQSSFQMFVEGAALGYLADLVQSGNLIDINLKYFKLTDEDQDFENLPSIFRSIFGLEILHVCENVFVDDGEEKKNRKNDFGSYLWGEVLKNNGCITSGKEIFLVSRHGYEVPKLLREIPSVAKFPGFSFFQQAISPLILQMRAGSELKFVEKLLIEWIHQMAENAFEHGGIISDGDTEIPIDGYRGIHLQKYIVEKNTNSRCDFPDKIKEYVNQFIETNRRNKIIINVATVSDLGMGIQNTLPEKNTVKKSLERLNEALKDGVTRKKVIDEEAGYGLGQALNAAKNLKAMLYVISANIVASLDLSNNNNDRLTPLNLDLDIHKQRGTSISIVWVTDVNS